MFFIAPSLFFLAFQECEWSHCSFTCKKFLATTSFGISATSYIFETNSASSFLFKKNVYSCTVEAEDWVFFFFSFLCWAFWKRKFVVSSLQSSRADWTKGSIFWAGCTKRIGWAQIMIWKFEGTLYLVVFGLGLIVSIFILLFLC